MFTFQCDLKSEIFIPLMFVGIASLRLKIMSALGFTHSSPEILFYSLSQHALSRHCILSTMLGPGPTVAQNKHNAASLMLISSGKQYMLK